MVTDADSPDDEGERHSGDAPTASTGGRSDSCAGPPAERNGDESPPLRATGAGARFADAASVATAPETFYLTRIAVLEARVAALESSLARRERDLRTVRDRYERLLDGPESYRGPPLDDIETGDGGRETDERNDRERNRSATADSDTGGDGSRRSALDRLFDVLR